MQETIRNVIEKKPKDPFVSRYIEKYQFYAIDQPTWIKTVPNNRIECWKIFSGGFEIWDETTYEFLPAQSIGGYAATNNSILLRIPDRLYCLNLKFYLRAVSIPGFSELFPPSPSSSAIDLIGERELGNIDFDSILIEDFSTEKIDVWIKPLLEKTEKDGAVEELCDLLKSSDIDSVAGLAEALQCSTRHLGRLTKRVFNLSPKELLSIYRFAETTRRLKSLPHMQFLEALTYGYYDQSHFIRECRKIAGVSPKKLFSQMKLATHDLRLIDSECR